MLQSAAPQAAGPGSNSFKHHSNPSLSYPLYMTTVNSSTFMTYPASNESNEHSQPYLQLNMELQRVIDSPMVQQHLPDLLGLHTTDGFELCLKQWYVSDKPKQVKTLLRGFAEELDFHEQMADLWKHQYKNQHFTLKKLLDDLNAKRERIIENTLIAHGIDPGAKHDQIAKDSPIGLGIHGFDIEVKEILKKTEEDRAFQEIGLPEFEDLYSLIACKTRALYSDLQVSFASSFITKDSILHEHKPTDKCQARDMRSVSNEKQQTQKPPKKCTARYLRNFLRAIWFHLLHPKTIRTIEMAINARKYQYLKAHPLVPANFYQMDEEEQEAFNKSFKTGSNLDAPTLSTMFQHLDDVSTMPVPEIFNKIFKRRMVYQVSLSPIKAIEERWVPQEQKVHSSPTKVFTVKRVPQVKVAQPSTEVASLEYSWVDPKKEETTYMEREIERAESWSAYKDHGLEQATSMAVRPPRTDSLMPTTGGQRSPPRRIHNQVESPVPAVKVEKWLPNVAPVHELRSKAHNTPPASPSSKYSREQGSPVPKSSRIESLSSEHTYPHASSSSICSRPASLISKTSRPPETPSSKLELSGISRVTPVTPSSKHLHSVMFNTPSSTIKTPSTVIKTHSTTSSPSSRRIPFLDKEYTRPLPPIPPPTPKFQLQPPPSRAERGSRNKPLQDSLLVAENERLKRENSQLQEALQQARDSHNQKLNRETSGLREALQQVQNSPRGLIRRMSKLGSQARSKSPRKSVSKTEMEMVTFDMRARAKQGRASLG